jgi:methyl-accepting chemotaxis protein
MLLYELEESEMANSLVSSTANLSESAAKLANFSDRLPERIQEQLTLLLDDVDRKQANLQETLRQAEKVSGNVQAALDKVRDASISIDTTAQSVKDTADAWREAAKTTGHVAKEIMQLKPERKDSAPPTSIQDVQQTIDKVAAAAVELRTASAELKQLAESDFISKTTATLVWRAVELVAAILAMTLLYKWIARKMDKTTKTAV